MPHRCEGKKNTLNGIALHRKSQLHVLAQKGLHFPRLSSFILNMVEVAMVQVIMFTMVTMVEVTIVVVNMVVVTMVEVNMLEKLA